MAALNQAVKQQGRSDPNKMVLKPQQHRGKSYPSHVSLGLEKERRNEPLGSSHPQTITASIWMGSPSSVQTDFISSIIPKGSLNDE